MVSSVVSYGLINMGFSTEEELLQDGKSYQWKLTNICVAEHTQQSGTPWSQDFGDVAIAVPYRWYITDITVVNHSQVISGQINPLAN